MGLIGTAEDFSGLEEQQHFRSVGKAMVILFQIMTLEGWHDVVTP